MRAVRTVTVTFALLASAVAGGCVSTGTQSGGGDGNPELLTREEILGSDATNLYDVINRLRPRWLQVRSQRSFSMETEIVVFQNEMYLGGPEVLKEMVPDIVYEVQHLEGARAATALPGLMSGRHIEGAIIVKTR
ncbi:MAG: hypothetical protein MUO50_05950 [Longimicrobiales bacterium]|nr:hypothetical protein [Longimicrobiales bacterium]